MNISVPDHIAETIKFCHVCNIAERIRKTTQVKSKEKVLERYYESFLKHRRNYRDEKGISPDEHEDGRSSFFCVLRCLMPQEDRSRKAYDLQTKRLGSIFIKVFQIPEDSHDAQKLKARSFFGKFEDYAAMVYGIIKVRCREENSNLSLREVHEMLDKIASEDVRSTEMVLTTMTEKASGYELKWFIRLLLKSMGLGLGEQRIFNILHSQAKEIFQRCSDLEKVCKLIADNNIPEPAAVQNQPFNFNLNSVIEPFQHIRPMLCERFPGNIEEIMAKDVLYMERKMDGERFQLHFSNGRFKYISRNGIDYTYSFGSNFESGKFSCLLKNIWPIGLKSVILDGEMMIWDEQNERFREKGENTDVKNLSNYPNWRPCFVVYDLLYLNGQSLLDMNYVQRNFKMQELIQEEKTIIEKMKPQKITSVEEFLAMFQSAIDAKAEGVVIKKQNSKYLPGIRFGGGWYKDKADYIKGLTEEFDLLVIGGFYNTQRTFIESLLVGVLKEHSEDHYEVYSVGKVANNLIQRANLNSMLKPNWHSLDREMPPSWYHYVAKNAEGRPDVWIEPQKSCILQIKAADLSPSGAFALRKSLHFPRIVAWRNDKVWNECMALQEFNDLCDGQQGIKKLNKRESKVEDFTVNRKRQKETPAQKRKKGMESYEKRFKSDEIEKVSDIFEGFYICILSGSVDQRQSPEILKALAVANGAELVENPLPNEPKCINVAGDESYRLKVLKKSRKYDIVSVQWFLDVCEKQVLHLAPENMVCMTKTLEEQFAKKPNENYDEDTEVEDEDKDNETEDELDTMETQRIPAEELENVLCKEKGVFYTVNDVQKMLDNVQEKDIQNVSLDPDEKVNIEKTLFGRTFPKFLKNCNGLFLTDDCYTSMAKCYFLLNGGTCFKNIDEINESNLVNSNCIYIFLNPKYFEMRKLEAILESKKQIFDTLNPKVLNLNWIIDSSEVSRKLDVSQYVLVEI